MNQVSHPDQHDLAHCVNCSTLHGEQAMIISVRMNMCCTTKCVADNTSMVSAMQYSGKYQRANMKVVKQVAVQGYQQSIPILVYFTRATMTLLTTPPQPHG